MAAPSHAADDAVVVPLLDGSTSADASFETPTGVSLSGPLSAFNSASQNPMPPCAGAASRPNPRHAVVHASEAPTDSGDNADDDDDDILPLGDAAVPPPPLFVSDDDIDDDDPDDAAAHCASSGLTSSSNRQAAGAARMRRDSSLPQSPTSVWSNHGSSKHRSQPLTASEFRTPGIASLISPSFYAVDSSTRLRRVGFGSRHALDDGHGEDPADDDADDRSECDTLSIRRADASAAARTESGNENESGHESGQAAVSPTLLPAADSEVRIHGDSTSSPQGTSLASAPVRRAVDISLSNSALDPGIVPGSPVLGSGRFGTVVGVFVKPYGAVARKVIKTTSEGRSHTAGVELAFAMRALELEPAPWAHIVRVHEASHDPVNRTAVLTMEYMRGGTAAEHPLFRGGLDAANMHSAKLYKRLRAAQRVVRGVVHGLQALHDRLRTVHRDLKPENILLSTTDTSAPEPIFAAKVADFGCVALLAESERECNDQVGTTIYMAPERIKGHAHGFPSDVWAAAVTALQLALGGRHPIVEHGVDNFQPDTDPFWALEARIRFLDNDPAVCQSAIDAAVDRACEDLDAVAGGDERCAALVTQLRAFARRCLRALAHERPRAETLLSECAFVGSN